MQVRDSLEDKSMLLVTSERLSLSLYLGTDLKEELTDYCFNLKVTRVFSIPTQENIPRERMVNTLLMIKINATCKRLLIFVCQEKKQKPGLYLQ